jgi:hypothetical protein
MIDAALAVALAAILGSILGSVRGRSPWVRYASGASGLIALLAWLPFFGVYVGLIGRAYLYEFFLAAIAGTFASSATVAVALGFHVAHLTRLRTFMAG